VNPPTESISVRIADRDDVRGVLQLIRELAEYERMLDQVIATEDDLTAVLFGPRAVATALLVEVNDQVAGFAFFCSAVSTFRCRAGIHLEDFYVRPAFRRHGVGQRLLAALARHAVDSQLAFIEWRVLNWNEPALQFYAKISAEPLHDWTVYQLSGQPLRALANQAESR
jgi:GNAT superfamily N-acetyltransferase